MRTESLINIKTADEVVILREAGQILSKILQELKRSLKPGITTKDVDIFADQLMRDYKVVPAFKGYRGYPASICISLNEEVVHGIPGNRVIKDGDIVSLDVGLIYKNFFSDSALSVGIGTIAPELEKLLKVTEQALFKGIEQAVVNNHLSDISHAVQAHVEQNGFSVVRDFVGHGIGRKLHGEPEIPNYGPPHQGPVLKEGMVLAIEPMVNLGDWHTVVLSDGWTVITNDRKPSAHFEHSILITAQGPEIFTK